jgi:hypothetical protein
MMPDETVIALSKTKLVLAVIVSCVLVALCAWFLTFDDASIRSLHRLSNPLLFRLFNIFFLVFCGLCAVLCVKRLFKKGAGLILNSSAIIDNATGTTIPWSEILEIKLVQIKGQKMLGLKVTDPQKYIECGSSLQRMAKKANYKMFGMPVFIMSNALKISFPELAALLDEYKQKYGSAAKNSIFPSGFIN